MDRTMLASEIAAARTGLVADLAALPADRWDTPSLCQGWSVRDVAAHLVLLERYECDPVRFAAGVVRSRGPNRFMGADARRFAAERSPTELLAALDASVPERRWIWRHHPSPDMLLGEFVLHGMDMRRPLGLTDPDPLPRLERVADLAVRAVPRVMRYPLGGWTRPSVRFEATDADWSWGKGPVARGPLASILLVLAERPHGLSDLTGEGTAALAAR